MVDIMIYPPTDTEYVTKVRKIYRNHQYLIQSILSYKLKTISCESKVLGLFSRNNRAADSMITCSFRLHCHAVGGK